MKPHYLAIPAAVELYLLIRRGWRTDASPIPSRGRSALVAVAHFVSMYTIFREYGRFVMPLAVEAYAPIGDAGWRGVLTSNVLAPTLLALVIFGLIAVIFTKTMAARVLVVFGIGAAISAIAQAKGWPYHVLPALSAAILLAALTVSQTVDRYLPISRSGHHLPVAVISATLMVLLYFQAALYTPPFYKQRQFEDSIGGRLQHIIEQNAPHRTIMALSPGIYPLWPMINYIGGRMTMRFLTMWVLQGVYATCDDFPALYNPPDTMGDSEKLVFDQVSEDFAREQPDLLIVDRIAGIPRCQGKEFDYLEYFLQNRVFADAFEGYEHLMDFDRYRIYRRKKKYRHRPPDAKARRAASRGTSYTNSCIFENSSFRSASLRSAPVGMTWSGLLPLPHRLRPHRLGNLLDVRHLEHAGRDQDDLAAADQVAAAEAEVDGAPGDARGAFEPLAELGAAHELGAERHRRMRPADAGGVARAHAHHHVGHGDQQAAMRPAHRIAVARLERQADPELLALGLEPERADQPDEVVGDVELAEAFGNQRIGHAAKSVLGGGDISRARRAPPARTACCDGSPRSATP